MNGFGPSRRRCVHVVCRSGGLKLEDYWFTPKQAIAFVDDWRRSKVSGSIRVEWWKLGAVQRPRKARGG